MRIKRTQNYVFLSLVLVILGPALYLVWNHVARNSCIKVSVKLSDCNTPIFDAIIEDKICPLLLDLGSKFSLTLDSEFLGKINKQEMDLVKWRDWKGNPNEAKSYLIPKVEICGLLWSDVIVKGQNQEHKAAGVIWHSDPQKHKNDRIGAIGCPLLKKTNLCLDLYHRTIYFCNSLKMLQKMVVCPKDMIKVPFRYENNHVIVQVESDIGKLNLVLDTGATISFVKSPLNQKIPLEKDKRGFASYFTSHLAFEGKDFGELKIHVPDACWSPPEIDGILGMNFLENQIVYIDYLNRVLYIGDCHFENE